MDQLLKHDTEVYVVSANRLAADYLTLILAKRFSVHPCNDFLSGVAKALKMVFVLDNFFLFPPLGELLRKLAGRFPSAKYVIVDRKKPEEEVAQFLQMGIHAFVEYSRVANSLPEAVLAVADGRLAVSNEALQAYVKLTTQSNGRNTAGLLAPTSRESQVLELVKQGLSNKEIAKVLKLQESTVKYHVSNILGKLQVGSRHELLPNREITTLLDNFYSQS